MLMTKKIGAAALSVVLGGGAPRGAGLATCARVEISFHNGSADSIKVTKFEYQDGGAWKSEDMFGGEGHQTFDPGARLTWTRDLAGVAGASTSFKATYRHHLGGDKWGAEKVVAIGPFTCVSGKTKKTLELNK